MFRLSDAVRSLGKFEGIRFRVILALLFALFVAWLFPSGESIESDYHPGMIWTEKDVIAPFSFPIYKEESEYTRERDAAAQQVYRVFALDPSIKRKIIDSLQSFFRTVPAIIRRQQAQSARQNQPAEEKTRTIEEIIPAIPIAFTEKEWNVLSIAGSADNAGTNITLKTIERDVLMIVNEMYQDGILNIRKSSLVNQTFLAYRLKTDEYIFPVSKYLDLSDVGKKVHERLLAGYHRDSDTMSVAQKIALTFIVPNIIYQQAQTEAEIKIAMDEVPRTVGVIQENERIIARHERVTGEIKLKLDSLRKAKAERGADINQISTFLGKFLHVIAASILFIIYLSLFRKKVFLDNTLILLIAVLLLLPSFFAFLSVSISVNAPIELLIIIPAASMLLAIIFDSRIAFYGTITASLIVAGIRGNDYSIALCSIVAGSFAIYTVRDINHRTQIFRSIIFIFLGYALTVVALSLERYEPIMQIFYQLLFAAVNAVFSPVITYGMLIFFERVFRVTTDLTLIELGDFNHPLLREVSQKAPGTFNHSVNLGTMAEAAAEAIGANAILAQVGGYYHDIGKILRPELFVENQLGTTNKHERMSPQRSAKIIATHVTEGISIAKEYGLPDIIVDFLPMHHGTTMIGFFYEQAMKKKKQGEDVVKDDFRYPGPKPQTRETGIVMLADVTEAACRAIEQPTVQKIEERIDSIIKGRFLEGELDDSDLTLRDLSKIKSSFVKIMTGIHHARIKYPEQQTAVPEAEPVPEIRPAAEHEAVPPPKAARPRRQRTAK